MIKSYALTKGTVLFSFICVVCVVCVVVPSQVPVHNQSGDLLAPLRSLVLISLIGYHVNKFCFASGIY